MTTDPGPVLTSYTSSKVINRLKATTHRVSIRTPSYLRGRVAGRVRTVQVAKVCILAPQPWAPTPLASPGVGARRDILIIFLSTNGLLTL